MFIYDFFESTSLCTGQGRAGGGGWRLRAHVSLLLSLYFQRQFIKHWAGRGQVQCRGERLKCSKKIM
jgi:hypothetical protein